MAMTMQDDVHQIRAILRRIEAAENTHSPDDIIALMAEDVVLMVPDYEVAEGKEAAARLTREIAAFLAGSFERHIRYASSEVRILGDAAFDRGTFEFVVFLREVMEARINKGKYFILYTRADDGWRISRVIISRDDPEEVCEPGVAQSRFGLEGESSK